MPGIIFKQMIIMAVFVTVGAVLRKAGLLTREGNKGLSNVLLYVILPSVIVNSFLRESDSETTRALLIALGIGVLMVAIAMVVSTLLFRRSPVANFSASYSNAGFMGIPLVAATIGSEYVIYTAAFVAIVNILQWTYGQYIMSDHRSVHFEFRKLICNPLVIALLVGLLFYFLPVKIPEIAQSCIRTIAGCNAPVAMFILGFYLCELPFRQIFTRKDAYAVSAARLILIPAVSILLLKLIPAVSTEVKAAILICAAAPVGSNVAIYAERCGQDYTGSVIMVCLSTVFSIGTMPLVMMLFSLLG